MKNGFAATGTTDSAENETPIPVEMIVIGEVSVEVPILTGVTARAFT
jgi:hypothetical protein